MSQADRLSPEEFEQVLTDVHTNYRSGRLAHEPPDQTLSDAVTGSTLRPHLAMSSVFFAATLALAAIAAFVLMVAFVVSLTAITNPYGGQGASQVAGTLQSLAFVIMTILATVVLCWIGALFVPISEPIAEYGLLVEGRGAVGNTAYWWIKNSIQRRHSPFVMYFNQVNGVPILRIVNGKVTGLIVVYSIGSDLYFGWTMWRARSTMTLVGHILRDMFQGAGVGSVYGDLRSAAHRALRELIHSVVREGVQVAILQPAIDEHQVRADLSNLPNLVAPAAMKGPDDDMPSPEFPHHPETPMPPSDPPRS